MIHINAFDVQDVETGGFLTTRCIRSGPPWNTPTRYEPVWDLDPFQSRSLLGEDNLERMLREDFQGTPDPDGVLWAIKLPSILISTRWPIRWEGTCDAVVSDRFVRKVRTPACECCGGNPWGRDRPRRTVQKVADGTWRCEKHIGRNPCFVEGCGKTRAAKRPSSEDCICGAHWRLVPLRLKQRDRRIWKHVRRHGWDDALARRYWRNWECIVRRTRAIINPPKMDIGTLVTAGPPPATLIAELEKLGL